MVVDMHVVMSMGIHDHCIRLRGYDSRANHCQPEGRRQKNFLHEYPQFGTNAHQPDRARTVPSSREVQADVTGKRPLPGNPIAGWFPLMDSNHDSRLQRALSYH